MISTSLSAPARGKGARRRARPAEGDAEVRELARRLDDHGCAFGRVSAARLEDLVRAYERLETKLNAVLLAATGTFLTSLVGIAIYTLRSGHP